jgi:hypothetical protein
MGVYLNVERVGSVAGEVEGRWRSLLAPVSVRDDVDLVIITLKKYIHSR